MKVTVTAKDSFAHGAKMYHEGDPVEVSVYDARELAKRGLTDYPDEGKAEDPPSNKMEEAPANKMMPAADNKDEAHDLLDDDEPMAETPTAAPTTTKTNKQRK